MLPSRSKILVEAKSKTPCPHEVAKSPLRGIEHRSLYWEPAVKITRFCQILQPLPGVAYSPIERKPITISL